MRLLTHNQLICIVKNCTNNFPLKIIPEKIESISSDVRFDFITHIYSRLDIPALLQACKEIGINDMPEQLPNKLIEGQDNELIRLLHRVLCDIFVVEGSLQCNSCGRVYPIKQGVPNMLLNETET